MSAGQLLVSGMACLLRRLGTVWVEENVPIFFCQNLLFMA